MTHAQWMVKFSSMETTSILSIWTLSLRALMHAYMCVCAFVCICLIVSLRQNVRHSIQASTGATNINNKYWKSETETNIEREIEAIRDKFK